MNPGHIEHSFMLIIILKRCRMGSLATVAVEEDSLSVYVTSSFSGSNEFHIYKSTGDFIHGGGFTYCIR